MFFVVPNKFYSLFVGFNLSQILALNLFICMVLLQCKSKKTPIFLVPGGLGGEFDKNFPAKVREAQGLHRRIRHAYLPEFRRDGRAPEQGAVRSVRSHVN